MGEVIKMPKIVGRPITSRLHKAIQAAVDAHEGEGEDAVFFSGLGEKALSEIGDFEVPDGCVISDVWVTYRARIPYDDAMDEVMKGM